MTASRGLGLRRPWTAVFFAALLVGCRPSGDPAPPQESAALAPGEFSSEVKAVLAKKTALLEELSRAPQLIAAVKAGDERDRGLTAAEVQALDEQWQRSEGTTDFVKPFLANPCAELLADFQGKHPGFPEIFVTDGRGLIVAATNRTSDYLQADEAWWVDAFADGRGKTGHGEIEYDESAHSEAISLYVPVIDPGAKRAIGVLKAVCDVTAIKMEL